MLLVQMDDESNCLQIQPMILFITYISRGGERRLIAQDKDSSTYTCLAQLEAQDRKLSNLQQFSKIIHNTTRFLYNAIRE